MHWVRGGIECTPQVVLRVEGNHDRDEEEHTLKGACVLFIPLPLWEVECILPDPEVLFKVGQDGHAEGCEAGPVVCLATWRLVELENVFGREGLLQQRNERRAGAACGGCERLGIWRAATRPVLDQVVNLFFFSQRVSVCECVRACVCACECVSV